MTAAILPRIKFWKLTSADGVVQLLRPAEAEARYGIRIYNLDRPRGLVPIFEETRAVKPAVA